MKKNELPLLPLYYFTSSTTPASSIECRVHGKTASLMSVYSYNHHARTGEMTATTEFAPGSGAEFMARQLIEGWDRSDGGYSGERSGSVGQISFYAKSSRKRYAIISLSILTLLLIAAIVVILLFVFGVFKPALNNGESLVRSLLVTPLSSPPLPPPPASPLPALQAFPAINPYSRPRAMGKQVPITTSTLHSTTLATITSTTVITTQDPLIDQMQNRTFAVSLFILQQANGAYDSKTTYAYLEAFRMINDAVINLVTTSTLQQYMTFTTLEDLRNSGDDLEVRFRIQLVAPSRSGIDIAVVRNVLVADLYKMESRLNQITIDPNRVSVTRIT